MERHQHSSYPLGGSYSVDLHWGSTAAIERFASEPGPVEKLKKVIGGKLLCWFHTVKAVCSRYPAMLQQSELIFDFASDHVSMSQVSKCGGLWNKTMTGEIFQSNVAIKCILRSFSGDICVLCCSWWVTVITPRWLWNSFPIHTCSHIQV